MKNDNPMVSVLMITYGHELFINEAIEGVLNQQCEFQIELIIANDNSTDSTDEKVKKIIQEHPNANRIKYTKHQINIGMMPNFFWILKQAKGKFIAICDGDDYWIDQFKLQKQVDFLKNNEDFSFCFHRVYHSINGKVNKNILAGPKAIPINSEFQLIELIKEGGSFVPICSMFFKNNFENKFPTWFYDSPVGDLPLVLYLSTRGKIGFIDDVMSVYRVKSNIDSWTNKLKNRKKRRIHYFNIKKMWNEYDKYTDNRYTTSIRDKINLNKKNFLKNEFYVIMNLLKSKLT